MDDPDLQPNDWPKHGEVVCWRGGCLALWVWGSAAVHFMEEGVVRGPVIRRRLNRLFRLEFIGLAL